MKAIAAISSAAVCALVVAGARANEPEHQQGVNAFGEGVEGQRFYFKTFPPPQGQPVPSVFGGVTLTIRSNCDPAGEHQIAGFIPAYHCLASGTRPICGQPAGKEVPVVLVKGYWESNSEYRSGRPETFTVSCSIREKNTEGGKKDWGEKWTGALAKCVELWMTNVEDGKLLTACIHMARAGYDGNESETYPGTWVDAYDVVGTHRHDHGCSMPPMKPDRNPDNICKMWVEATWDQNGAVCISHRRYESLQPRPEVQNRFNGQPINAAPDAGTTGPIMHCRRDAEVKKKIGAGLAVSPALITNRSIHHKDRNSPTPLPPPAGDRAQWDDPECVQLCGHSYQGAGQRR